jgi:hypothetical protein
MPRSGYDQPGLSSFAEQAVIQRRSFAAEKYAWISAAFPRIAALRIATVRLCPDGILRARSRASIALELNAQAKEAGVDSDELLA